MSTSLITEYSLWFIFFCFLLGAVFAWILYRRDNKFKEASKLVKRVMFGLRFFSVSIIAFLLLTPLLKNISKTIEKPKIIFAQDNSESVFQSEKESELYKKSAENLFAEIKKNYDLNNLTFGEEVKLEENFTFTDKETNISELLTDVQNRYFNQNIGALIIASDGIYNKGENPVYSLKDITFPVYTIALGDTGVKKDLIIRDVKHNKIAFLNNIFPVQVIISSNKLKGKFTELRIYDKSKLLHSEKILINKNDFFKKINFDIKAEKTGIRQLRIVLSEVKGEISIKNNVKNIIVEVIDSKKKILMLANSPHPDIAAIRQALNVNQNYDIEYYNLTDFKKSVKAFNLVILHQIPSITNSAVKLLTDINKSNIPVLYILGTQTGRKKFDKLQAGVRIMQYRNSFDDVQAIFNGKFSLFELNDEIKEFVSDAPPLKSPFGEYRKEANSEVLFYRKIKNIPTSQALFIFSPNTASLKGKSAVITGEGLWRWRIFDYRKNENHILFNEFINKTVQYLTLQVNKDRFRVYCNKIIPENSEINFTGESYNKSYELINKEEVSLVVTDSAGTSVNYVMNKTGKSYSLNLGTLPKGEYKWNAKTMLNGEKKSKSGIFTVTPVNIESVFTTANHNLLHQISEKTGGKMFYPEQADSIISEISKNENIVSISYSEKKTESLINLKIIFFIILLLLSGEWFMRKFHGSL